MRAGQLRCGSGLLWSTEIIRPASTVDPMRLCAACATVIGELAVVAANLAHPLAPSPSGTTLAAFINVSGLPFPNEGHLEGALQAPVLLAKKDWWEPRQSDLQRRPSPAPRSTDTCLAGSRLVSGSMRPGTFATLSVKILVIPTL